jgi:hypothetical protein
MSTPSRPSHGHLAVSGEQDEVLHGGLLVDLPASIADTRLTRERTRIRQVMMST